MFRIKAWIAIVLIACLILPACQSQEDNSSLIPEELIVPEKTEYKTFTVTEGAMSNFTANRMKVEYLNSQELTWGIANSYFDEVLIEDGATVKEGDVLMTFYSQVDQSVLDSLKLELIQKKQEVLDAKAAKLAAIDEAKTAAESLTSYEKKIAELNIRKQQLDYDKYVYETDLEIAELEADLADKEASLEKQELVAPFDGKANILYTVVKGAQVDTSETLIELYSFENYYFVPTGGTELRYNMEVSLDIGGSTYTGRVITAPNILPNEGSIKKNSTARIQLDQLVDGVTPSTRAQFMAYPERVIDVLQVDSDFINNEGTERYVNVLDGDVVRKRYVIIGMTNRKAYWILNGLSEGQIIING